MKRSTLRSIASGLYKSVRNYYLLLSVALLLFSLIQPVYKEVKLRSLENVLAIYELTTSIGAMREMECIAYALIASQTYFVERRSGYLKFALQREGRARYLTGCAVSTGLYTCASILISLFLFVLTMRLLGFPLYPTSTEELQGMIISGSDLLQGNTPWKIWFVIAACLIISSVTWTLTSLAVSACTDNLFVVVLSPMLLSYLLHAIMLIIMKISYDPIYDSLDYYYLGRGITPISDPAKAILTTCQWYLPVIVAALPVFFGFAVRRSQYE